MKNLVVEKNFRKETQSENEKLFKKKVKYLKKKKTSSDKKLKKVFKKLKIPKMLQHPEKRWSVRKWKTI